MAKGQVAKNEVAKIILDAFGDKAFLYNDGKEIRVDWTEAGESVQIKVALTASKVAVERGGDTALPAAAPIPKSEMLDFSDDAVEPQPPAPAEPSADEKQVIADLIAKLGL